jgi:hypothetical protein
MRITEELFARGHPNVLAKHPTTFEITKESNLTRRGNCVIGVEATKGPNALSRQFRYQCQNSESRIVVELEAKGILEVIEGRGSPKLTFSHPAEMVGRTSSFVSNRTIMIQADRAARDLDRDFIGALRFSSTTLCIRIVVES